MDTTHRAAHWLRRNAAERVPRRVITLDCEAWRNKSVEGERHELRVAVASFDHLDATGTNVCSPSWLHTDNPCELWTCVDDFVNTSHRTVLFAHNVSYDVRISGALRYLPMLGYKLSGIALNSYSFWAQFKSGRGSLWVCDSLSFIPASLDKIASAVGREREQIPDDDCTYDEALQRCRTDVEITREAILRTLRFIKREQLGDFRTTGPAQASAAFRHRFLNEKSLLVHDDEPAIAAERRAAFAGRAEVWKHGEHSGVVYEYDYANAYAQLARVMLLPTRFQTSHSGIPYQRLQNVMREYAVVADVTITTEVACVPAIHDEHIVWPVGQFETTLWDSELQLAHSNGATIEVQRYWYYRRTPLLKEWAEWIIGQLSLPDTKLDPVVRFMLKDWSRSLIGRFGLRYSTVDEIATLPTSDVRLFGVHDGDSGDNMEYLQLGTQLFERMARVESPNSTPAVMSAIMATSRVKLWNAMQSAGFGNIFYVDTDGLIVDKTGAANLNRALKQGGLYGLRLKAKYNGGDFRAPRNVDLGEIRRVSGAPRKAERLAPSIYRGEVWESLPTALRHKRQDSVFLHERTFTISDHDRRRTHLKDGATAPLRLPLPPGKDLAETA